MPTYLCHGFRWHRHSIRVFVVLQDLEEAAPEWILSPQSTSSILEAFYKVFDFIPEPDPSPDSTARRTAIATAAPAEAPAPPSSVPIEEDAVLAYDWSAVKLLEEYDPNNLKEVSRPYAFVADHVVRVDLDVSVAEEIARYEERMAKKSGEDKPMLGGASDEFGKSGKKGSGGSGSGSSSTKKAGWLEKLRDQLQTHEEIRWFVVVCDDEDDSDSTEAAPPPRRNQEGGRSGGVPLRDHIEREQASRPSSRASGSKPPKQGGLRRLFGKKQDDLG
ncbi:unnamed protein product [Parascedosporium putredinis]|uniref:Developmental regulator protein n=1 Tax=Parascedosporium putredinis TaxID=1442378 RepID=A0A9P1GUM6_9PEZI|nr:unnamed protein product [Parascedosporium putredinis]CAI7987690.1 unnamed protein product [Parascedosporium putredinis]